MSIGVDFIDRLNVGLVGIGRQHGAGQSCHIAEHAGHRIAVRRERRADRRIVQRIERGHQRFRRLRRQVIGYPRLRIGPEIRRHLLGGAQAYIEIGGDLGGIEAELRGSGAVDRGKEGRSVDFLLEVTVDNAWDRSNAPSQLARDLQILSAIIANRAHVDLRGQPKI